MNRDRLKEQLTLHEGKRNHVYTDTVGKATIGVGRNLVDRGLSDVEISMLLVNDILDVEWALDEKLPWWRKQLNDVRQRVLADMAFNLGIAGLLKFKNTLALIQSGQYQRAADAMLASKWAKQVGKRALRLAQMMRTGEDYTN